MSAATPPLEVLEFLVRTLPSRALWKWLNEEPRSQLRYRVAQGFRATPEVLRQPVARARLVSHLQNSSDEFGSLLNLWSKDAPGVLQAVQNESDDATLIAQLPVLQAVHGAESLVLALMHEEREAVLEALAEVGENASQESETPSTPDARGDADFSILEKKLEKANVKVEALRAKAHEAKTRASQTEKMLREKLLAQEKIALQSARNARQLELKLEVVAEKLNEAEKIREREERRARSTLAASEDAQIETKTLRRQVHRLQQIGEELRGQIALAGQREILLREQLRHEQLQREKSVAPGDGSAWSTPEAAKTTREKSSPANIFQNAPIFENCNDSAAKIKTAIDGNDETFVATLRGELKTLRERDAKAAKKLIVCVRELGRYYERVLCDATTRVLVDASNVARHDGPGKGKIEYLRAMREELRRAEFFPILFIADASLPHHINDVDEFRRLVKTGAILVSASGQEADEILARQARETGAYVVTNDRNFHRHLAPAFTPSRVGFRIEESVVLLDGF